MLAYNGVNSLDVVGPLDVLSGSISAGEKSTPDYVVKIVSPEGGLISTSPGGVRVDTKRLNAISATEIDTLMVAGCENIELVQQDTRIINWIKRTAPKVRRVASVCTGAFLLAEAGLLNGRAATTHWRWAAVLADKFPKINVAPDKIYVKDGRIFTSAGITAGMDLALALIEEDLGTSVAMEVARNWVMFLKRPGGQSQFSTFALDNSSLDNAIDDVIEWAHENLDKDLSVETLASKATMSARNFARRFTKQMGLTPGKYIEAIRLQAARDQLETSSRSIESIADSTGFTNSERMRRTFVRHLNVSPQDYRTRFQHIPR